MDENNNNREAQGYGPAPIIINNVTPERKQMRHGLHLLLTICTGGLWLPVWLIVAISRR